MTALAFCPNPVVPSSSYSWRDFSNCHQGCERSENFPLIELGVLHIQIIIALEQGINRHWPYVSQLSIHTVHYSIFLLEGLSTHPKRSQRSQVGSEKLPEMRLIFENLIGMENFPFLFQISTLFWFQIYIVEVDKNPVKVHRQPTGCVWTLEIVAPLAPMSSMADFKPQKLQFYNAKYIRFQNHYSLDTKLFVLNIIQVKNVNCIKRTLLRPLPTTCLQ